MGNDLMKIFNYCYIKICRQLPPSQLQELLLHYFNKFSTEKASKRHKNDTNMTQKSFQKSRKIPIQILQNIPKNPDSNPFKNSRKILKNPYKYPEKSFKKSRKIPIQILQKMRTKNLQNPSKNPEKSLKKSLKKSS